MQSQKIVDLAFVKQIFFHKKLVNSLNDNCTLSIIEFFDLDCTYVIKSTSQMSVTKHVTCVSVFFSWVH